MCRLSAANWQGRRVGRPPEVGGVDGRCLGLGVNANWGAFADTVDVAVGVANLWHLVRAAGWVIVSVFLAFACDVNLTRAVRALSIHPSTVIPQMHSACRVT